MLKGECCEAKDRQSGKAIG